MLLNSKFLDEMVKNKRFRREMNVNVYTLMTKILLLFFYFSYFSICM